MNVPEFFLVLFCGLLIVLVLFLLTHLVRSNADPPPDRFLTGRAYRTDDRHWYGFFYNNPDDPAVFVPKRYGWGWTVNFGHPVGQLFMPAILLVMVLSLVITLLGVLFPGLFPASGCHPSGCRPFP